jgi:two-component system CitB family sensor kinase/two-component system sensor histidine kinase DcuS
VSEVLPRAGVEEVLATGEPVRDREVVRLARALVVNLVPVLVEGEVVGAVASFRRKDDIEQLTRELAQTRESAEMRRVQAHEFSNRLHTIAGLIQLEAYQEALDLILRESTDYQELIAFLGRTVPDPDLSGLILGKMNRAGELKVSLSIDRGGRLRDLPDWLDTDRLVTVLGNLLDNALEAAVACTERPRRARLSFRDEGGDLVIEVEDSGRGVPEGRVEAIFQKGVTAKSGDGHGVGLYLVAENLRELGGGVRVTRSELGGAAFSVIIPKQRSAES